LLIPQPPGENRDPELIKLLAIKDLASKPSIAVRFVNPNMGPNESF